MVYDTQHQTEATPESNTNGVAWNVVHTMLPIVLAHSLKDVVVYGCSRVFSHLQTKVSER